MGTRMKRSEMIKFLSQPIMVDEDITIHLYELEADAILLHLEDAGMLPPDLNSGGHCSEPDCCGGPDHSWELE